MSRSLSRRRFIATAIGASLAPALDRSVWANPPSPRPVPDFGVMLNDDGDLSYPDADPARCEAGVRRMIASLEGTAVKTLMYSIGAGSDVLYYPTRIANTFGWRKTKFDDDPTWAARVHRGRAAAAAGLDPVRAAGEQAKAQGLFFVPSYRMNDMHFVVDPDNYPLTGEFWLSHRDLRIGRSPVAGWDYSNLFNFVHEPVRAYRLAIIREALTRYADVMDGFELDFNRFQVFFAPGQVAANAHLLTEIVARVRGWLDELGVQHRRTYYLFVRVPPALRNCAWSGIEIATWIERRFVDVVIPSQYITLAHDVPVAEFVALARGAGCTVYPAIYDWTHWRTLYEQPNSAWPFHGDTREPSAATNVSRQATPALVAGAAANFHAAGADGFQLYNFNLPLPADHRAIVEILATPAALANRPRIYAVAHGYFNDREDTFQYRKPLPVSVKPGMATPLTLLVGEKLSDVSPETAATFRLGVQGLARGRTLTVRLNGQTLAPRRSDGEPIRIEQPARVDTATAYLHFPITDRNIVRLGPNRVELIVEASPAGTSEIVVRECQLGLWPSSSSASL